MRSTMDQEEELTPLRAPQDRAQDREFTLSSTEKPPAEKA